ncbi:hypothetical protein Cyrtocomes_01172 [Candidatus Cyrtobacter comes]|uniref:Uncharacterized protein n=1 Tax=Candidatus Cyrtobacter comes TaxID=675776 RepID=A0ABU5L9G8_9RICK|nr:hypothetical protein [Candidatus Cyrtobacter comes]MDZ5762777.1 hypothetical protein [Candidatus Cyrtobacter comes]
MNHCQKKLHEYQGTTNVQSLLSICESVLGHDWFVEFPIESDDSSSLEVQEGFRPHLNLSDLGMKEDL